MPSPRAPNSGMHVVFVGSSGEYERKPHVGDAPNIRNSLEPAQVPVWDIDLGRFVTGVYASDQASDFGELTRKPPVVATHQSERLAS